MDALIAADTVITIEADAAEMAYLRAAHEYASDHGPCAVEFRDGEVSGTAAEMVRVIANLIGMLDDAVAGVAWGIDGQVIMEGIVARLPNIRL